MGIIDLNYRMLPVPVRLKTGLEALAELMAKIGDERVKIDEFDSFGPGRRNAAHTAGGARWENRPVISRLVCCKNFFPGPAAVEFTKFTKLNAWLPADRFARSRLIRRH